MTKNRKIELLVNDNKRLIDENRKLHKLNNEEISRNMLSEMERYSDVIDLIPGKTRLTSLLWAMWSRERLPE